MLFKDEPRNTKKALDRDVKKVFKIPEREDTMRLQVKAFLEGRKPSVLFLNRDPEKYFGDSLDKFKQMEIDQGIMVYRDEGTGNLIERGHIGLALGYGIDSKPSENKVNITAFSPDGIPVVDIQVNPEDPSWKIARDCALYIAGEGSSWEFRSLQAVNRERQNAR